MEQQQIEVTAEAIAELRALLNAQQNLGAESFIKPFRVHCEKHGWDWFGLEPKKLFDFNAVLLIAAYSNGQYHDERLSQMRAADFELWVFRADPDCPDEHVALDGLALPPDHGFWNRYFPPLGWRCGCSAYGASSERQVRRLGGDPDKKAPRWWTGIDPRTELPPGIEEPWIAPESPGLLLLLAAIVDGHSPKPDFG